MSSRTSARSSSPTTHGTDPRPRLSHRGGLKQAVHQLLRLPLGLASLGRADRCAPRRRIYCCLRMADGLNTRTRRGRIVAGSRVFGLRPRRSPFWRTTNEPKELNFTVSPRSNVVAIVFRTWLTSVLASPRDRPIIRCTASVKSSRVTVFRVTYVPPHRAGRKAANDPCYRFAALKRP